MLDFPLYIFVAFFSARKRKCYYAYPVIRVTGLYGTQQMVLPYPLKTTPLSAPSPVQAPTPEPFLQHYFRVGIMSVPLSYPILFYRLLLLSSIFSYASLDFIILLHKAWNLVQFSFSTTSPIKLSVVSDVLT